MTPVELNAHSQVSLLARTGTQRDAPSHQLARIARLCVFPCAASRDPKIVRRPMRSAESLATSKVESSASRDLPRRFNSDQPTPAQR